MQILTRNKKIILILKAAIKFFKILDVHVYVYIYMYMFLEGNLVRYSREAKKKSNCEVIVSSDYRMFSCTFPFNFKKKVFTDRFRLITCHDSTDSYLIDIKKRNKE